MPDLFITNFDRSDSEVSTSAASVIREQVKSSNLALVGYPLPNCPAPISLRQARSLSRSPCIWHVRRPSEMWAALWARDILKRPIHIVYTATSQQRLAPYSRWMVNRMDRVIAATDLAAARLPRVDAVIAHGVDTTRFTPAQNRHSAWEALGFSGTRGIASFGRISPRAGTDTFVDTMIRLLPDHPDTTALVIGRASREHQKFELDLKDRVQRAGFINRIRFVPDVPRSKTPALMQALSLTMQLTRHSEYGMAVLQSLASGTPFIGCETGHHIAFASHGSSGTLVAPAHAEWAAQAAHDILSDPGRHESMASAARQLATTSFSIQTEAAGIKAVYDTLRS